MSISSAIAIYFIIWWLVLFAVLPIGIRSAHEAGEPVEAGNDAGAPVNPDLFRKALITTVLAAIVFVLVYFTFTRDWLALGRLQPA
jgi:predicted secreted protein